MNRAGCHEHVNTVLLGALDRLVDFLNIRCIAARKAANHRAEVAISDRLYRLEIARGGRRKTGFDDVDLELGKRLRNTQLFPERHAATRGLFPIAQGGVENAYPVI